MRFKLKKLSQIIFLLFLGICLFIGSSFLIGPRIIEVQNNSKKEINSFSQAQISLEEKETINIILVGDIMLNRGVEYMIQQHNDWKWPFLRVADEVRKADILFGNLESVISDKGTKVGSIYSLRAEPEAIEGLTFAGFDIMSLANNHAFDYTVEALKDTFVRLKMAGIDFVGADLNESGAFSPMVKQVKEKKIAFLAYTNLGPAVWRAGLNSPGIAWIDRKDFEKIKEDIVNVKQKSDVLIVSLHAGTEYETEPNQFQKDFSKMAIEAGADLVVGHHPHVVQPYEKYPEKKSEISNGASKNGWIFYSLGNFVFDQSFSQETMKGQMVKVVIQNGKINEVIPINIKINDSFQPEIEKK